MKPKILLIEDESATRFGFVRYFSQEGYQVCEAADLASAARAFAAERFDAIVLDVKLPDGSGIDFIGTVRAYDSCLPIIVITGSGDIPLAVDAMRRGADNFLTKPVDNASLALFLRRTLDISLLKRKQVARQRLETERTVFFGACRAMEKVQELARIAASCDSPVLITGETGTGKGMLARWMHQEGPRSPHEFVEVNCSGLRGELLARELFGNVRGAFTSADQDRKGLLDIADRGTLFLDEIGDMGLEVQGQLLKVLEEKTYRRVGDVKLRRSDFRLVCATNRDTETLVRQGLFRRDLFYRINLMVIHLPPLRERVQDLPGLVRFLLDRSGAAGVQVTDAVMGLLTAYSWPGNIRELDNVLERARLLSRGAALQPAHFPGLEGPADGPVPGGTMEELETGHLLAVLDQKGGSVELAAKILGISRATFYRKIKRIREQNY
jgi:DNA-binding NtrC family response regulator